MAIDLEKQDDGSHENTSNSSSSSSSQNSSNQGSSGRKDYNDPNSHPDVRAIYVFAYECKRKNMPDYQIEQSLMNKGLEPGEVGMVMSRVNRMYHENQANAQSDNGSRGGGGTIPSGLIIVGLIILFDILSFAFGWGFIIY